jgi:hypothetical protein
MISVLIAIAVSQTPAPTNWKQFESLEGRYVVQFPGPVKQVDQTVTNVYGKVRYRAAYTILGKEGFHVAFDDHPKPPDPQKFLISHWEKMVAQDSSSQVISRELTTWKGFSVLEGKFYRWVPAGIESGRSEEGKFPIARIRLIMVGERLYQLLVTSIDSQSAPVDAERFFDSFRLFEPARL